MTVGIWTEFMEARRTWNNIFSSAELKELTCKFCIWQNYPLEMKRGGKHTLRQSQSDWLPATLLWKKGIPLNRKSGKNSWSSRERELKKQKSGSRYFGALSQQIRIWLLWNCHAESQMKTERWSRENSSTALPSVNGWGHYPGQPDLISWSLEKTVQRSEMFLMTLKKLLWTAAHRSWGLSPTTELNSTSTLEGLRGGLYTLAEDAAQLREPG